MTTGKLTIQPVHTEKEKLEFIHFQWEVYRDDPLWVPPLVSERVHFLDREHHPFYEHADVDFFIARRDGKPVGTVAVNVNHRHNEVHDEQVGFFGYFEVLEDREAAEALLETAGRWVKERGMTAIRGPATFSLNEEAGLLVDGWNGPPVIMMTYNPRYYVDFVEGAGFAKAMDLVAYMLDIHEYGPNGEHMPPKLVRVAKKIQERGGFTARPVNLRHFDDEVVRVKTIYNEAWQKNWGFVPLTEGEIDQLASDLRQMIDPDLIWVAERDGETIAMLLCLPDLNQPLLKAYPRPGVPEWWTLAKFWYHWKVRRDVKTLRGLVGGVLEERRGLGIMSVLMVETALAALRRGYRHCELSWILENNTMTRRTSEMLGAYVYRTYRIYEKAL